MTNKQFLALGEKLRERVKLGIKFLDKNQGREKWIKKINLSELELGSNWTCICGQVFGDWADSLSDDNKILSRNESDKYGFSFSDEETDQGKDNYDLLTCIWRQELGKIMKK